MTISSCLDIRADIQRALSMGTPVVALESTIIAHGLPWPANLDCARRLETVIGEAGALPATIGVCAGRIKIGLTDAELEKFASAGAIAKVSRRDLAAVLAQGCDGATTVAATMICAHLAGIAVFATGGIGGVHRGAEMSFDISADLIELGRTPVAVICAGAKSILDLPKTLEVLETQSVPVIGYGTDRFPAFYVRDSGLTVDVRSDTPEAAARLIARHRSLNLGGMLIAVPIPETAALSHHEVETWVGAAQAEAEATGVKGKALTPFLLKRLNELSKGRALAANLALVENNARVAAAIAKALAAISLVRAQGKEQR
ncbi:MAG: pseudouridine-5'-phosphate glycosidase [Gammaproteobacteria bacterium]